MLSPSQAPAIRWLALCALLCVLGLQLLEVSHAHDQETSLAQCQLCNGAADTLVPVAERSALPAVAATLYRARSIPLFRQATHSAFYARGPPCNA